MERWFLLVIPQNRSDTPVTRSPPPPGRFCNFGWRCSNKRAKWGPPRFSQIRTYRPRFTVTLQSNPAPRQDQQFSPETPQKARRFWYAQRLSSNPLIPPKFRLTLQCHPAHHQHHGRISNFRQKCPNKRCDFGAHLHLSQIRSHRPESEWDSSATQPTTSTTTRSPISATVAPTTIQLQLQTLPLVCDDDESLSCRNLTRG